MTQVLLFERVKDGVVCHGLRPGIYEASGKVYREFMQMAESGGFWPYRVKVIGCDHKKDKFLIRIDEIE